MLKLRPLNLELRLFSGKIGVTIGSDLQCGNQFCGKVIMVMFTDVPKVWGLRNGSQSNFFFCFPAWVETFFPSLPPTGTHARTSI